nr:sigma-70 family RNA polymerase sigma factor [Cryobacterium sp. BB736]
MLRPFDGPLRPLTQPARHGTSLPHRGVELGVWTPGPIQRTIEVSPTTRLPVNCRRPYVGIRGRKEGEASDEALVLRSRSGNSRAFAELWRRHATAARRVAGEFTTSLDADDLVSEAYLRIYEQVRAGGGPTGAFRPYLYTVIRNLAARWGSADRAVQVPDLDAVAEPILPDDPSLELDRSLTARAFGALPARWQAVLWYTEVEGLDPHQVAPYLGMNANSVAALAYRAREGLRRAWLQAHVSHAGVTRECRWVSARIGDRSRDGLGARDRKRFDDHIASCARCGIVAEEVEDISARLAAVLLPLTLGGVVGGSMLAAFGAGRSAHIPDSAAELFIPDAAVSAAAAAPSAASSFVTTVMAPIAGGVAMFAGVAAGVTAEPPAEEPPPPVSAEAPNTELVEVPEIVRDQAPAQSDVPAVDPSAVPDLERLVGGVIDTLTGSDAPPPAHSAPGGVVGADISLAGTGTPGARVSLQAAGQIYATTSIAADGSFSLVATAVPSGVGSLELVQAIDESSPIAGSDGSGVPNKLTRTGDPLVADLMRPLSVPNLPANVTLAG